MMGYISQYLAGLVGKRTGERHPTDVYLDKLFFEAAKDRLNFGYASISSYLADECEDYA
jgi:hypothetical protein